LKEILRDSTNLPHESKPKPEVSEKHSTYVVPNPTTTSTTVDEEEIM